MSDETDLERWRFWATPAMRGPWKMLQMTIDQKGWYVRLWKGVKIADMDAVQIWGVPPRIGLIMSRATGERLGLLYESKPPYLK